ncbi:MAG: response regulator transcription factor [Pseudomonadota bacterium]
MIDPRGKPDALLPVVHIVDDDPSIRTSLEDLLASVGLDTRSFGSTQAFLDGGIPDAPGCLVLDIRMPGQSGLDFQQQMASLRIGLPVIFITGHGDIAMTARAMKQGAIEFLSKPFDEQALLDAIHRGIELDRARRRKEARTAELLELNRTLNAGEREVMELVVEGLLNKQIAARLDVSEITVKARRGHVMRKMRVKSVPELVRVYDRLFPGGGEAN